MTAPKTLVALDVDGVLKPSGSSGGRDIWIDAPWQGGCEVDENLFATLRRLGEIVWLTTWFDEAPEAFAGHLDATTVLRAPVDPAWWKYHALAAYLDTRPDIERVIWIDDEMGNYPGLTPLRDDWHPISPHSMRGLCPSDLAGVLD